LTIVAGIYEEYRISHPNVLNIIDELRKEIERKKEHTRFDHGVQLIMPTSPGSTANIIIREERVQILGFPISKRKYK